MSPFVVINFQKATCHAGFYVLYLFLLFCSCIFEVFGGGVKVACWCQLMVQTRAADQPVSERGSNIAQQSSGIMRGFIYQI